MKTVLITGCSAGGVGSELALRFASLGQTQESSNDGQNDKNKDKQKQGPQFHVFASLRTPSKADPRLASLPNVTLLALDVTSAESLSRAVRSVGEWCAAQEQERERSLPADGDSQSARRGKGKDEAEGKGKGRKDDRAAGGAKPWLDVLVNNAGLGYQVHALDYAEETARGVFDVNYWGTLAATRAFAPLLIEAGRRGKGDGADGGRGGIKGRGTLVNVCSVGAVTWIPTMGMSASFFFLLLSPSFLHLFPFSIGLGFRWPLLRVLLLSHPNCICSPPPPERVRADAVPLTKKGIYQPAKAAQRTLTQILRLELAPLGVRTVCLMMGGVKTRFADNTGGIKVPAGSLYEPIAARAEARRKEADTWGQEADVFAREVVDDIMKGKEGDVWRGGMARFVYWTTWLPGWVVVSFVFLSFCFFCRWVSCLRVSCLRVSCLRVSCLRVSHLCVFRGRPVDANAVLVCVISMLTVALWR